MEPHSSAYLRLITKLTKENLWLYILKMLMDRPMYAYEITKTIQGKFGFTTATITVYVVLYKMRREGLIQIAEERIVLGKPERKYYQITEKGNREYVNGILFLEETLGKLTHTIQDVKNV
ncbi:MAG: PadR family transcriptional regulator [Candidatus Bathyarchaeota archaeon]|nr:PadR family transcriptional regulator [Candidatus Bathyarchaeota archaeon]